MTMNSLEFFLNWMAQHTVWVNIFIFLVAMSESLLVVGLIVPGFILMVGFGALIAIGHLDFWPTVLIAVAGAIAGDSISYWLGQHYKQQLVSLWPLSKYPSLIKQGQNFFNRHGKKSVVLARFFGPLRAIVPTIAGMSNMPTMQFYFSNILSAIVWAPLYLLPGILFGMSLQLAKEFAGQLVFLISAIIILILLIIYIIKILYRWLTPQANVLSYRLIIWARKHPLLGKLPDSLVNPKHSEVTAISSFGFLLIISALSLIVLNHYLFNTLLFNNLDDFIVKQFSLLQHPVMTSATVSLNAFSNHNVIFSTAALFSIYHLYRQHYKPIFFIIAAIILPWGLLLAINGFGFSFNAFNHLDYNRALLFVLVVTVYGFITSYIASQLSNKYSQFIYIAAFTLITLIAFSQLYTGQQYFSSLLGHSLFGIIWVAILSIAYRQHPSNITLKKQRNNIYINLSATIGLILLLFIFIQYSKHDDSPPVKQKQYVMSHTGWLETGWELLPAFRNDLQGEKSYPLNVQWIASKQEIISILNASNWQQVKNSIKNYSNWFKNISQPTKLPIVKHIHNGLYNALTFSKTTTDNQLLVIRLWPSIYYTQTTSSKKQLWYGEIAYTQITTAPMVNYLTTVNQFNNTLEVFSQDLAANFQYRKRSVSKNAVNNWDGNTILIE